MTTLFRMLGLDALTHVRSAENWQWHVSNMPAPEVLATVAAIGLVLAVINFLPWIRMRGHVRLLTCLLRLGMVAVLLTVLCGVELTAVLSVRKLPRWLVLLDDSGSMATADVNGGTRFKAASADLQALQKRVGTDVALAVETLSGVAPSGTCGTGPTLIHQALTRSVLQGEPVDRVVLLTDGRDVEGHDFTTVGKDLHALGVDLTVGVYGSEGRPADAAIFAEPESETIRLGEPLVVHGSIIDPSDGEHVVVLKENGEPVKEVSIAADHANWFRVVHTAAKPGSYRYSLELAHKDALPGNNSAEFMVRVVEERIKVLLLEGIPRYEFKLLRYALDVDPMIQLASVCHLPGGGVYVQGDALHKTPEQGLIESAAELFKYDVVIVRDVPRSLFRAGGDTTETRLRLLVDFVEKRGGGLLLLGGQDVYRAGGYGDSALAPIIPFDLSDHYSSDDQFPGMFYANVENGLYDHALLRLLPKPDANRELWQNMRELDGCNNVGRFRPLATPLLTRLVKIPGPTGELQEHKVPVMGYQAVGEGKVVAASVDTFWRWQLQPECDDPPLQALLANIVRYIAPPPAQNAGEPSVSMKDMSPQVGQEVLLSTWLKNTKYEPIRNADLKVNIKRPDGQIDRMYPRDLPEQPGYYEYRVLLEMPGLYEVEAVYGKMKKQSRFIVGASGNEYSDLSADRPAMIRLAQAAGGMVEDSVDDWLRGISPGRSTVASNRTLQVWNSPLALLLFLALVCVDCYVRKRQGLV